MRRMITSKNDEIDIFKDQLKEKDEIIAKYHKFKAKLHKDYEQAQGKLIGKPYLIGARRILWDHII
jgi:hypothetical protein